MFTVYMILANGETQQCGKPHKTRLMAEFAATELREMGYKVIVS